MSEAQRAGKEMKEERTGEDNVVCLPVATIQARARHLATPQRLREGEWWDLLLNPVLGFICSDKRCPQQMRWGRVWAEGATGEGSQSTWRAISGIPVDGEFVG